jgi:predicted phosphoribosyltransferase/dienelactone hydrolase
MVDKDIRLSASGVSLMATLQEPPSARGVVVFAHGSGSSRFSPRNRRVAEGLHAAGLATVLLDLLTPEEEAEDRLTSQWRFNIPLLGQRLTSVVDGLRTEEIGMASMPVGLFGASTGAAAALMTASDRPDTIRALVSRGGRPDLAFQVLPRVRCPTLLIVGELDREVMALNRQAIRRLSVPHRLAIISGATHLFAEPGALETVTALAKDWFREHLMPAPMVFHPPLWRSRQEAGAALADRLRAQEWPTGQTVLLALPRGGVPVGAEVARRLGLPLATWSVRKVADPSSPELAIGAVAAGGVVVWRDGGERAREQGWLQKEERELARRQALFGDPDPHHLQGRHLVVIDDGIATGMTVRAALLSLKQLQPASLTLAVPVVDREVAEELAPLVNRLEALALVDDLRAVGLWYEDFNQLSDREVIALLGQNRPFSV